MSNKSKNLAVAYSLKRKAKKMAEGGKVDPTAVLPPMTEDTGTSPMQPEHYKKGDVDIDVYKNVELDKNGNPVPKRMAEGGEAYSPKAEKFISKRMHTFGKGGMHSTTKHGPEVTNPKQAIAIAMSEAREKGMKVPKEAEGGEMKSRRERMMDAALNKKMAEGGDVDPEMEYMPEHEENVVKHNSEVMSDEALVDRIMKKREQMYSEGGQVANKSHIMAGDEPTEFDDLTKDDDLEFHYTDANSGDELGDAQEDKDREDMVSRIMRLRKMKASGKPNPA